MIKRVVTAIKYKIDSKESKKRKMRENRDSWNNVTYDTKKRIVNIVLGLGCVGYGIVTIHLPTGSIWAISLGITLIACPFSIWQLLKGLYRDIKYYVGVRL